MPNCSAALVQQSCTPTELSALASPLTRLESPGLRLDIIFLFAFLINFICVDEACTRVFLPPPSPSAVQAHTLSPSPPRSQHRSRIDITYNTAQQREWQHHRRRTHGCRGAKPRVQGRHDALAHPPSHNSTGAGGEANTKRPRQGEDVEQKPRLGGKGRVSASREGRRG